MATNPIFTIIPNTTIPAQISVANTNRDGTGTISTLVTAGANGTMIKSVSAIATVTTAIGLLRLFINDGTNTRLYEEIATAAVTPSGTQAAAVAQSIKITPNTPLFLPTGWSLKVATNNAETWNVFASAEDF